MYKLYIWSALLSFFFSHIILVNLEIVNSLLAPYVTTTLWKHIQAFFIESQIHLPDQPYPELSSNLLLYGPVKRVPERHPLLSMQKTWFTFKLSCTGLCMPPQNSRNKCKCEVLCYSFTLEYSVSSLPPLLLHLTYNHHELFINKGFLLSSK